MTNAELIKALQCASHFALYQDCYEKNCYANSGKGLYCNIPKLIEDAADALEAAEKRIAELEKQIPKEGEWIEDDATYCGADLSNYKCSLCGKIGGTWRRGLKQDELPPFCGSCGARMKGGQE